MRELFDQIYNGKRVFVTGHTGFKGSWLALWLTELGAEVAGYSDKLPTTPNHFQLLDLPIKSTLADIGELPILRDAIHEFQPEIVFHLAAQPLVRYSYQHPIETFNTNVMGTAHLFEACRDCSSVRAIVTITSDKAYENLEVDVAYKESDRMGGYDPYSASKGCAELIVNSYRNSFFNLRDFGIQHHVLLASARAGNVIGGGDWAQDRLIPDLIKCSAAGESVVIRNPYATRPWQHVLEPLSGYLQLGQKLLERNVAFADGWNFGPLNNETMQVNEVLEKINRTWTGLRFDIQPQSSQLHEAHLLRLDCTKANKELGWYPVWSMDEAIEMTAHWYKSFYDNDKIITKQDLQTYVADAKSKNITWTL